MKKQSLNKFLGRKTANSSLFSPQSSSGTDGLNSIRNPIELTDWDNINAVVSSASFPDSGTARVRARPKVNLFPQSHFTAAPEIQGFAVPTPTVPASHKGPANPATENGVRLNGNSEWNPLLHSPAPNYMEEEHIYIPPPPAMAPPPPPQFAPPPPPFQAPAMAPPNPPKKAPPNPPKTAPPISPSLTPPSFPPVPPPVQSIYRDTENPLDLHLPRPKFAPPPPPSQKEQRLVPPLPPPTAKALKVPPPKPIRYSSMQHLDIVSQQPEPVQIQRNPQNKARLSSFLPSSTVDSRADREQKAKSMMILQDSATEDLPAPANSKDPARVLARDPKVNYGVPVKPARKNSSGIQLAQELESMQDNVPYSYPSSVNKPNPVLPAPVPADYSKPRNYSPPDSLSRDVSPPAAKTEENSKPVYKKDSDSRSWYGSSVPVSSPNQLPPAPPNTLQTKLSSYYSKELSPPAPEKKDSPKSPMDLLLAAKRRAEKGRSLSRQSSQSSNNRFPNSSTGEMTSDQIHQSPSNPNSFVITPRADLDVQEPRTPGYGASPPTRSRWQDQTVAEEPPSNPHVPAPTSVVSLKHQKGVESSEFLQGEELSSTLLVQNLLQSQRTNTRSNLSVSELARKPEPTSNSHLKPSFRQEESEEDFGFIPPPPEFANADEEEEEEEPSPYNKPIYQQSNNYNPPPSTQTNWKTASNGMDRIPSSPVPKTKPQINLPAPRLPTSLADLKLTERTKPSFTTHPSSSPQPAPTPASVTLQSILQKKMLEMDLKQKCTPAERNDDTWSTDQPTESWINTVKPGFQPTRSNTGGSNMQLAGVKRNIVNELKTQVKKKSPEPPALASQDVKSNATQNSSTQSHGRTFTVRPGTKQPITLLRQGQPC
ncbi:extensin-like isoform X1 [Huso huso]|uniref:Extensin-like isoform X1 n=1 Tax=Huso huso TaxID=61971 RepID=A0ABR0YIA5_HUSHU